MLVERWVCASDCLQVELNLSPSPRACGESGSCGWSRGADAGGGQDQVHTTAPRPARGRTGQETTGAGGPASLGGLPGCSVVVRGS